jgi:hypothetical protein
MVSKNSHIHFLPGKKYAKNVTPALLHGGHFQPDSYSPFSYVLFNGDVPVHGA